MPAFLDANNQEKELSVGVKKGVLFLFLIRGFFSGHLTLRIMGLGRKSGTKKTVPNNRYFRRLLAVFSAVCAVI